MADWGRPGCALGRLGEAGPPSRLSLAEGARRPWAVRESVVDDVEASMATVSSRTGDGRPVRPPVAMPASGLGGSGRSSWPAPWSRLPRIRPGEGLLRLGRLPGVGSRGRRPGKTAQCSECLEARRPDNFFRRTRGSRLGYPWPFTPTILLLLISIFGAPCSSSSPA